MAKGVAKFEAEFKSITLKYEAVAAYLFTPSPA
jgi:hypothetical protein